MNSLKLNPMLQIGTATDFGRIGTTLVEGWRPVRRFLQAFSILFVPLAASIVLVTRALEDHYFSDSGTSQAERRKPLRRAISRGKQVREQSARALALWRKTTSLYFALPDFTVEGMWRVFLEVTGRLS